MNVLVMGIRSIICFQITPTKRQVYGTYKCKAVNLHGEVFYEMKLDEGFAPGAITNVYVNTTTGKIFLYSRALKNLSRTRESFVAI